MHSYPCEYPFYCGGRGGKIKKGTIFCVLSFFEVLMKSAFQSRQETGIRAVVFLQEPLISSFYIKIMFLYDATVKFFFS
jgi:hypothetical protein